MGNALLSSVLFNTFVGHFFSLNLRQKCGFEGGNNRKISFVPSMAAEQPYPWLLVDEVIPKEYI